jgi:hypothetical protein
MDWNFVGAIVALVLTVMVYSYLIGDNFIFRLAEHILVGVSVGFAFIQVLFGLIVPALNNIVQNATNVRLEFFIYLIPVVLGILLLARPVRAARPLTNLVMALVIGTVSALALAGALAGTLLPQLGASMSPLNSGDVIGKIVLLLGTLLALWYFQFTFFQRRPEAQPSGLVMLNERIRRLGRWSIMLAFGAIFASVFLTYFAALVDRLLFVITFGR